MHRLRGHRGLALAVLVATAAVLGGAAYAAIPDGSGVIHGCYMKANGALRVVDPATGGCLARESALDWNVQGRPGAQGPPGDRGPAGPAGTVGSLDDLDGIPCRGTRAHPGRVRVSYETTSRTEAAVSLTCVTTVVANPGPLTVRVTGGSLGIGLLGGQALPTSGWQLSGQIDSGGNVTIPASGVQLAGVPFAGSTPVGGFGDVHVEGTVSFASTDVTGFLDPETGEASLGTDAFASVSLTATAQILGQTVQIYAGTCSFGSAASPIRLALTTDPPGAPYSPATGALTLASVFTAPSLAGCSPSLDPLYAFVLGFFAGNGTIELSAAVDPIVQAT